MSPANEVVHSGGTAGRVLVVDDEPLLRRALRRLLTPEFEVVVVASGPEAVELLERDRGFDAVLCDLKMPEMSGMELHAWLLNRAPGLASRVVFISGGAFGPLAAEYAAKAGLSQVEKPFDLPALRDLLRGLVAGAPSRAASS